MSKCDCEHWESCPICCPERFDENGVRKPPEPSQREKDRKDAERLDWLDRNLDFQVGWNVGVAPVGLITVQGVAMRTTTIREAIDAAMQEGKS